MDRARGAAQSRVSVCGNIAWKVFSCGLDKSIKSSGFRAEPTDDRRYESGRSFMITALNVAVVLATAANLLEAR
ncbi:hypothetical protein T5B8_10051 [Salinisphaera sp. T5B8]